MPSNLDITPVHLSDFQKDLQHVSILLKIWIIEIRDFITMVVEKFKNTNFVAMKAKIEQQPIIICFRNLAKIVGYLGGLWLDSVMI